ncbi:MAG: GNAT family N-acetyltransferase [Anaerolineales bacterium]|nr:GNAT family N-acetyltransferase [Anaerolineales bacterium]
MNKTNRDVDVQPAGILDLLDFQGLSRRCFGQDAWPWFDMLAALLTPKAESFKAVQQGRTVGYVIGDRREKDLGWIASIAVAPEARRHGIGTRLLREAENALGAPRVRLALRPSNEAALNLYRQQGYSRADRWPAYYRDGEDALVMEKKIH